MNYLISGDKIYTPNACPVQNYNGCGENDGCYNYKTCSVYIKCNPCPNWSMPLVP